MLNSLNKHYKNCMVDGKENFKFDLGVKGLTGHKVPVMQKSRKAILCW